MKSGNERLTLILSEGEGERIEFKEGIGQLDREIVALANAGGGSIFVGVNDQGEIVGINVSNRMQSEVSTIARNCDPPLEVETFVYPEKVLEVRVSEGTDKPYRCKGGFFLRMGPNTQKLNRNEIRQLILRSGTYRFDEAPNSRFQFPQDIDRRKLEEYVNLCGFTTTAKPEDILISLDAARRVKNRVVLCNAGVLFFAKQPQSFIKESHISCIRYHGRDRFNIIDRQELTGNPIEMIENAYTFVKRNIRVGYSFNEGTRRKESFEYPITAAREAIINAVMHRDYFYDVSNIYISIYSDRLEIENPGGLYSGLTMDELGKRSVRRNRLIADLLFRAGYVERVGSGIPRMRRALEENKNPPMEISATNFFSVVFYPRIEQLDKMNLSERQFRLYQLAIERGTIKTAEAARLMAISEDTTLRELRMLVALGLIEKKGIGKNTSYSLPQKT
jgi:ATP-dependent DNA helicase RecG